MYQRLQIMLDEGAPTMQKFISDQVTWFRPITLPQVLELKRNHPQANMVVGNTEVGKYNTLPASVKISQNVDILDEVYLVHLKVKQCQTLHVASTFTGQNESTVFGWLKCLCVHSWFNSQKQSVDWF